jgi:nicotinamide-nucleotide amidase
MTDRAAIISLGTELMRGIVRDAHLEFLGKELRLLGIEVARQTILPDDLDAAVDEIRRTTAEYGLVIVTGGLGPTSDDVTREAIARAASVRLEFREVLWQRIVELFSGIIPSESNRRQAYIPAGFDPIENTRGTACGFRGRIGKSTVVVLPGPPHELQIMFTRSVIPFLGNGGTRDRVSHLDVSVYLVGESRIEDACQKVKGAGVVHRTRLAEDRVIVTFEAGSSGARAEIENGFSGLVATFGELVVKRGDSSAAERVTAALRTRNARLVTAESCTGGLIGEWITNIPGSSDIYWGGCTVYSNESKTVLFGVPPILIEKEGAVSREVVRVMAGSALLISPAEYALTVSGIAGPSGGTDEKPVGTVWISVRARDGRELTRRFHFSGDRQRIRRKAAACALLLCDTLIAEKDTLDILDGKC